jgi:hypothetical protein
MMQRVFRAVRSNFRCTQSHSPRVQSGFQSSAIVV